MTYILLFSTRCVVSGTPTTAILVRCTLLRSTPPLCTGSLNLWRWRNRQGCTRLTDGPSSPDSFAGTPRRRARCKTSCSNLPPGFGRGRGTCRWGLWPRAPSERGSFRTNGPSTPCGVVASSRRCSCVVRRLCFGVGARRPGRTSQRRPCS